MALGLVLAACGAPTSSGAGRSARTVTETVTARDAAATPDAATPDAAAPLPGGTVPASPIDRFRCGPATVRVSDAVQLTVALAAATAGQVISLVPGTYAGAFVAKASGTADRPIYLCGDRSAVIDGGSVKGGYGLHLDGAAHWRVSGFTVRNARKGVMVDHGTGIGLQDLLVEQIGDEAVHLRSFSTGNVVRGLTIRQTGLRRDTFGEGVYVGSAQSNWGKLTDGRPDASNGNFVLENTITQTTSEAVDVKEGTLGGVVAGNTFDGSALTGADSWVDVKGNGWLVADNTGRSTPKDGFQTHVVVRGWGDRNRFVRNTAELGQGTGVGFYLHEPSGNRVSCDNRVVAGTLTNATCGG
jgi:hypothetical protein